MHKPGSRLLRCPSWVSITEPAGDGTVVRATVCAAASRLVRNGVEGTAGKAQKKGGQHISADQEGKAGKLQAAVARAQ